ncbi:MAG: aquaporin [Chloroflexi bacterium]|nr:aquaporin [Chloroflexota bacterium]
MNEHLKPALAELVGTFTLVFIGAGAGALAATNGGGIVAVALAHGLALMVAVYALGAVSGAHVNPAVTISLALTGKVKWDRAAFYVAAQLIGGALAAYLLAYVVGPSGDVGGLGATVGSLTASDPLKTMALEAVLTFFLVMAVYASGVAGRNGNLAGVAIGLVLTMDILMGGSLTGASMNPARTFGPALATGHLEYWWLYIVGPVVGGAAAAFLYDRVFMPMPEAKNSQPQSKGKK